MGAKKEAALAAVNLLDLCPTRAARWDEVAGRVVVRRPPPGWRGIATPLEWLAHLMAPSRLRLDALGSFAWRQLDGEHSVRDLGDAVRQEFGEGAEPVEERLGKFVRDLRRERLVVFPGWDDVRQIPDASAFEG